MHMKNAFMTISQPLVMGVLWRLERMVKCRMCRFCRIWIWILSGGELGLVLKRRPMETQTPFTHPIIHRHIRSNWVNCRTSVHIRVVDRVPHRPAHRPRRAGSIRAPSHRRAPAHELRHRRLAISSTTGIRRGHVWRMERFRIRDPQRYPRWREAPRATPCNFRS
jgi:hypothetical protein